jgi:hypothetical protein
MRQKLSLFVFTRWLLRYAPRFHGKKSKKNSPKKFPKKKFQKKISNFFFQKSKNFYA